MNVHMYTHLGWLPRVSPFNCGVISAEALLTYKHGHVHLYIFPCREAWCTRIGHPGASLLKPAQALFNQVSAKGLEIYKILKGGKRRGEEADAYRLAHTHLHPSPGPPCMHCDVGEDKGQSSRAGAGANLPSVARMQGGDLVFVRISRIEEENRQTQQRIAELQDDVKELKAVIAELHNKSTHCQ